MLFPLLLYVVIDDFYGLCAVVVILLYDCMYFYIIIDCYYMF